MRVVCIDDEHLSLTYIERQLQKVDDIDVIGTFTNPLEGKEFISSAQKLDAVFLDIEMSPINGIELADQILEEHPEIFIIFVTAYESFAVRAFEINAMDYLVKPVTMERILATINRIKKEIEEKNRHAIDPSTHLKVRVAPYLAFEVKPKIFEPLQWRTSKSQELFVYLLQNNGMVVEKSSIIDLLWNEYDMERAYSLLYTTIYNIRKRLKDFSQYIILHNHAYGYLLELRDVEIDMEQWERQLEKLSNINSSSISAYEKVMKDYPGVYLSDYDYTWLEAERHRLEKLWVHTAAQLAAYYMKANQFHEAVRWYNEIVGYYPMTEEAHFNLMKLYEANGEFTFMMQQYNILNKIWRDNFGTKPNQQIIDWYVDKLT